MYKKFDINYYQKGGQQPPKKYSEMDDEREKIKKFYNDMLTSQWYKDRLKKNGYANDNKFWIGADKQIERIAKNRLKFVNEVNVYRGDDILKKATHYNPNTKEIYLFHPELDRDKIVPSDALAHEYGHSETDYNLRDPFKSTALSDYEQDFIRKSILLEKARTSHDLKPAERKSDANAIRYHLMKKGLFDPKTGRYKTESGNFDNTLIEEIKDSFSGNRTFDLMGEENLINMMNTIAKNRGDHNRKYLV